MIAVVFFHLMKVLWVTYLGGLLSPDSLTLLSFIPLSPDLDIYTDVCRKGWSAYTSFQASRQ